MQTILRSHYLDVLKVLKGKNLIKVATGVRRSGKSTLMSQFQDVLRAENEAASIISINIDMPDFRFLAEKSWKDVYESIVEHLKNNVTNYVFIDEVQNVKEFEKLLEGPYVDNLVDIVPIFPEKERQRSNGDYKKLLPLLRMGRLESLAGCNN